MQSGPIYTAAYIFIGCKFLTEQLFAKVENVWIFELCDPASPFCSYLTFTKTGRVFWDKEAGIVIVLIIVLSLSKFGVMQVAI